MSDVSRFLTSSSAPQSSAAVQTCVLQRKCACGNHTVAGGECSTCGKEKNQLQRKASQSESNLASRALAPIIQAKLTVGASNDPLEHEADRVADQVMATPSRSAVSPVPPRIQRFSVQLNEKIGDAPASVERVLSKLGRPMEPALRHDMEQRFGHDFSAVRLHSDASSMESAREVGAEAYTVGRDIVFDPSKYTLGTAAGNRLLAHELTHVVQQTGAGGSVANRMLSRYRSKKSKDSIAFEGADETLTDSKTQPWIESIDIVFDKVAVDDGHKALAMAAGQLEPRMPTGNLTAKYSTKSTSVLPDIVLPIVGGSTMLGIGLTDRVTDAKVLRLEGAGYTDSKAIAAGKLTDPVAKTGKGARYSASGAGTMNYAIFFKGIQAIHQGSLTMASHACVHVAAPTIRTLNHHTRAGVTTVSVTYDSSVLKDLCCHRKDTGNTNWSTNPCDKTKCP